MYNKSMFLLFYLQLFSFIIFVGCDSTKPISPASVTITSNDSENGHSDPTDYDALLEDYTQKELTDIRNGFEYRRDNYLNKQIEKTWPSMDTVWGKQNYAMAALFQNTNIIDANKSIVNSCEQMKNDPDYLNNFHWHGNLYYRMYKLFGHDSEYYPGLLSKEAENAIFDIFWGWAKTNSKISNAEVTISQTWYVWGSENHHAMRETSSYSAADILKDNPPYNTYNYDDGCNTYQHFIAWNKYFKLYFKERAKRGLLVEIASTYGKYTTQGWYNFYDFAQDAHLRRLAGMILNLWWADWSQDQINGIRGGVKTRIYQHRPEYGYNGTDIRASITEGYGIHFDKGSVNTHPANMCLVTSDYRIPLIIMAIALNLNHRKVYENKSRRMGLSLIPKLVDAPEDTNLLDLNNGGIYRYSYVTPDFIIGSLMFDKLSLENWTAISSQNRWQGVIFAQNKNARIVPQCEGIPLEYGKTYNQYWSVQNKGTLITKRLDDGFSNHVGDMRVYFSGIPSNMEIDEEDGWIFADVDNAYAAVKPAWGGYFWDDDQWIRLNDVDSPVIIEVARSLDFNNDFTIFKDAVKSLTLDVTNSILSYTGLKDSGNFTFFIETTNIFLINGFPVDLKPIYTFQSPYVKEVYESGIVTISYPGYDDLILDFNDKVDKNNLIQNGNFEQGFTGWSNFGSKWTVTDKEKTEGYLAGKYTTSGGKIYLKQSVAVECDTDYEISACLRTEKESRDIFLLNVWDIFIENGNYNGTFASKPHDGIWRCFNGTFNTDSKTKIEIRVWGNSGFTGTGFVDNVRLIKL